MAERLAVNISITIYLLDFEGFRMDSLHFSLPAAAMAMAIIAYGFLQVYG